MTLAEVAERVQRGVSEGSLTGDPGKVAVFVMLAFQADPDFDAGPRLRALEARIEELAKQFEGVTTYYYGFDRRLRELKGGP